MTKIDIFPNGCGVTKIIDGIDFDKIALESLKKDYIDWCKADRNEWLDKPINTIYNELYLPTRKVMFDTLPEEEKVKYLKDPGRSFGINMNTIKNNAMTRYCIYWAKHYGTPDNFIAKNGEEAFNRFFLHERDSKLDTRWEVIINLIEEGWD